MADPISTPPLDKNSLPGVPSGATGIKTVGETQSPGETGGLPPVADVEKTVIASGGRKGGRPRKDGLVPGSPEAAEADRRKDAEYQKNKRAKERLERPDTTLPPVVESAPDQSATPGSVVVDPSLSLVPEWTAEDFKFAGPDCVNLWETISVTRKRKRATDGGLKPVTIEKISKDAEFPTDQKRSLQSSSPHTLAKLFNACRVPLSLKPLVAGGPALVYLIVRDLAQDANVEKLIAELKKGETATPEKT